MRTVLLSSILLCSALAAPPLPAQDEEPPELGWSGQAELSAVATSGNSEGRTFGFKGELVRTWELSSWTLRGGGLGAESTTVTRRAEALPDGSVRLTEESERERTAESYFLRTRFDRRISENWGWFLGAGWERNEFAGIADRWSGIGGMERTWFESERAHLTTDAGVTLTRQDPVVPDPERDETFVGARFSWDYLRALTATTTLTSELALDVNLEESSDLRVDTTNAIAVSITDRLALKVGLQLLYDAEPALVEVPVTLDGEPTGEQVLVELDELDSSLTAALVLTF